eukprot:NODE_642_length_1470_cov_96.563688_g482_i0.p1 GENE.NODE_642_length_1470_cov_96.563688_g482_i0~~NODE_642_length_1470_cov_96.563688_g482_i0.p1  ORF type:complete len:455 (-),score=102.03 NODE_642_length_1470_cov_96.563688_g482_i0:105-1412(-)
MPSVAKARSGGMPFPWAGALFPSPPPCNSGNSGSPAGVKGKVQKVTSALFSTLRSFAGRLPPGFGSGLLLMRSLHRHQRPPHCVLQRRYFTNCPNVHFRWERSTAGLPQKTQTQTQTQTRRTKSTTTTSAPSAPSTPSASIPSASSPSTPSTPSNPRTAYTSPSDPLVIGCHNIMNGYFFDDLLSHYTKLHASLGFDIFCIQENGFVRDQDSHASDIVPAFDKESHKVTSLAEAPRLATVYNSKRLTLTRSAVAALPRLEYMPLFGRLYSRTSKPEIQHVLLSTFQCNNSGVSFLVANFHLTAIGSTDFRQQQMQAVVDAIREHDHTHAFVACGDTNAFAMPWFPNPLTKILEPLRPHRADDVGTDPTHFFARADEPLIGQQIAVKLGKLGIDWPMRYDVLCTPFPVIRHGQHATPGSDHDLLWAALHLNPCDAA